MLDLTNVRVLPGSQLAADILEGEICLACDEGCLDVGYECYICGADHLPIVNALIESGEIEEAGAA